jgi:hypothetical protein
MDRFSPNFVRWKEKGFSAVRPMPAYRHVYPLAEEQLREVAYFFDYEHPDLGKVLELAESIVEFGGIWRERSHRESPTAGTFAVKRHIDGGLILIDTRFNWPKAAFRLQAGELLLLRIADTPTAREALMRRAASMWNGRAQSVEESFNSLREKGALIEIDETIVSLPLLPDELRQMATSSCDKEADRE